MAKIKFYAIIEIDTEAYSNLAGETQIREWDGDKCDVAIWIDAGMSGCSNYSVDAQVWDNLKHFFEDNVLDTMAEG